jgi:predicted transcriptional regulator
MFDLWKKLTPAGRNVLRAILQETDYWDGTILVDGYRRIGIGPGQAVLVAAEIADKANVSVATVRNALSRMRKLGLVAIQRTDLGSIVTINSPEKYLYSWVSREAAVP